LTVEEQAGAFDESLVRKGGIVMKRIRFTMEFLMICAATAGFVLALGSDGAAKPFYQGRTLTVLINYAPGGPTDIEGRLVGRNLGRHIPGKPRIIVKNMGGAGGAVGVNYLGEVAKKNGFTMGFFTGAVFKYLISDPGLRVDLSKFRVISGGASVSVSYIRADVPPGIKKPADFLKAKGYKAGGLRLQSSKDVRFRLSLDLLEADYKYVTGYSSNSRARAAVQRGEVQFFVESLPGYRAVVEPTMVKTGMVIPLYYTDIVTPEGNVRTSQHAPELMSFYQFYKKFRGKAPSGMKWEALKLANIASTNLLRLAVLPPGSPPEALAALRQGYASMTKDPKFLKDAERSIKFHPSYAIGKDAEKLFSDVAQGQPKLKALTNEFIAGARKK
jgi:tripartite-type tricarboxylate transporter receptor subunit TctC